MIQNELCEDVFWFKINAKETKNYKAVLKWENEIVKRSLIQKWF